MKGLLIFHYASLETFKSIIENHWIWLCDIQKSNDSAERTYFENILLDVIDEYISNPSNISTISPYAEKALETFKSTYHNQEAYIPPVYSASFSLDGDLLGQWRAYANNGTGVSIGFKQHIFEKTFNGENAWSISYDKGLAIEACQYQIIKSLRIFAEEYKDNEQDFLNDFALSMLRFMEYKNIFFKLPQFREEKEYRIAYRHGIRNYENFATHTMLSTAMLDTIPRYGGFELSSRKHRISNNRLSSYYELSFSEKLCKNIISEVILGPKCQTEPQDVQMFLQDSGYGDQIKVHKSKIPYR